MNRYYITVLLLLFTAVSVLQATNVKIEPLKESTYEDALNYTFANLNT